MYKFSPLPEIYRSWIKTLITLITVVVLWIVIGVFFSTSIFNSDNLDFIRVLDKNNSLTYLGVIYAVQIPIFMLFLQQMIEAGNVYKKALPRMFYFKEIIVLLVLTGALVLFSPRDSYLYFPVILATLLSFNAIYRAVTVTFQFELYKKKIEAHLVRAASSSAQQMIDGRIKNNTIYNLVSKNPYIFTDYHSETADFEEVKIKAIETGYFVEFDDKTISNYFKSIIPNDPNDLTQTVESTKTNIVKHVHVDMEVYAGQRVKVGSVIARVVGPKNTDFNKIESLVHKSIKLQREWHHSINYYDELLEDVKKDFEDVLLTKSFVKLNESLQKFYLITQGIDQRIKEKEEKDYNLASAKQELSRMSTDTLASRLFDSFETLFDLGKGIIRLDDQELMHEFISSIYGKLWAISNDMNKTAAVRYESLFMHIMGLFIYKNEWNSKLTASQEKMLEDLLFRLKEHTGAFPYSLDNKSNSKDEHELAEIEEWLKLRIDNIRGILLASIKNDKESIFQSLQKTILEYDERHEIRLGSDFNELIKCTILLVYAYSKHSESEEYAAQIEPHINTWQPNELLKTVLKCSDENYAEKWRIDTIDFPADGVMRQVPNYDLVLKSVFVSLLIKHGRIYENTDMYAEKSVFEKTTFFTEGTSSDNNNVLIKIVDESDGTDEQKNELKTLIQKIIKIRREWENKQLADKRLDQDKVIKFKEQVNTAYIKSSATYQVLGVKNTQIVKDPKGKGYLRVGINQLYDKAAFIDHWHIGYANDYQAEQLGENIARTQDNNVIYLLLKDHQLMSSIDELNNIIGSRDDETWYIYGNEVSKWDVEYRLKDIAKIDKKSGKLKLKGVKAISDAKFGYIDNIPAGLYFVPMSRLGELKVKTSDKSLPVDVRIDSYSLDKKLRNEILKNPPEWLKQKGDKAEQIEFLKIHVRMLVNYVYKYEPNNEVKSLYLPLEENQ